MIDSLITTVSQSVPEAPLMTVREAVGRAERLFADQSNAWTERQSVTVEAGDPPYADLVPVTVDAEAVRVLSLTEQGGAVPYFQVSPDRLEFAREPKHPVDLVVVLRPAPDKHLPDPILQFWREGLIHGALEILYQMPQQWRNPELALYHQARFRDAQARARQLSITGYQQRGARVKPRRFI
jgi:hypothetical protein